MKKYMDQLAKLDAKSLNKRVGDLQLEIVEARRGVVSGEIQNNQVIKQKRQELARVNTLLRSQKFAESSVTVPKEKN